MKSRREKLFAKQCFITILTILLTVFSIYAGKPVKLTPPPKPTLQAQPGPPFRDNAVLQQKINLPIWGTSLPAAKVTVIFGGQTKFTDADDKGNWRVFLDPMTAVKLKSVNESPVGKSMIVTCEKGGKKAIKEIKNILIGDVWVCAGQSNMAGRMKRAGHPKNYPANSVNNAKYPALRFLAIPKYNWSVCSPETAVWISRVSFFFARRVQRDALVPMGLIVTAVGGSNIESWLNQSPYATGAHYTNLLEPVVGYGIRGAIWYQGESNEKDRRGYQPKLESLITGWRKAWKQNDFPVHFVQLPGIGRSYIDNPAGGDGRAEIRQAYFETLKIPNTGMAVTIDVGALGEHPPNKYDTGVRLARSVLQKVYKVKDISSCPLYTRHAIEGDAIRVFLDNAQMGLMIAKKEGFLPPKPNTEAKLQWLSIQDKDGIWHWADGNIDDSDLLVSNKTVTEPVAVRYAYTQHPSGNLLYNKDGMPVGPFSTFGYGPELEGEPKGK
jgi:sialate O-acetylesterase